MVVLRGHPRENTNPSLPVGARMRGIEEFYDEKVEKVRDRA